MRALVLVDIQNDFLPGGPLAIADADAIIPIVNGLMEQFELVVATRDWHPEDHGSFAATHGQSIGEVIELEGIEQILWPVHCVQGTLGAKFPESLWTDKIAEVIDTGTDPLVDSYSGFYDNKWQLGTGLDEFLRKRGVDHLFIVGLATDYCVKYTVLDALKLGFAVTVVTDCVRAIERTFGDGAQALEAMKEAGAALLSSVEVPV